MEKKLNIKSICFLLIIIAIMLFTIPGKYLDNKITLNGVAEESIVENKSVQALMDGEFQSELNSYIDGHFWGRKALIKIRSQLMYSLFKESPNRNVIIGKDDYLFEPEYICKELNIYATSDDAYFEELIGKLDALNTLCTDNDKELYVFITPSKAYFCRDKIPAKYFSLGQEGENNYQRFIRYLEQSNLKYFDSHAYIEEHSNEIEAPVFYSTGIHWSYPWGQTCAMAFEKYISSNSAFNLSDIEQTIKKVKKPIGPDTDLYESLNLICKPKQDKYYKSDLMVTDNKDVPMVFMRGGSFLGQSLRALQSAGAIHVSAHYENNYYFTQDYSAMNTLSSFDAYDEFEDLGNYLSDSDIIILEVNEAAIPVMSWGFIDYLLENPHLLRG